MPENAEVMSVSFAHIESRHLLILRDSLHHQNVTTSAARIPLVPVVLAMYLPNNLALPYLLGDHEHLGGPVSQLNLVVPKFPCVLYDLRLGKKSSKIGQLRDLEAFHF